MGKLKLEGVHPALDGVYEFEDDAYTKWELHCIKRLTGIVGLGFIEALDKGDLDLDVALAMVVLMREGKITSRTPWDSAEVKALWEKGDISGVDDEQGADADPPVSMLGPELEPPENESASNGSSGPSSSEPSELPEEDPSPTGIPT